MLVGGCVGKLVDTAACIFVKKEWPKRIPLFSNLSDSLFLVKISEPKI